MPDIIEENTEANEWIKFGMRIAVSTAFHPLEYAKVLIQIGYEPISPRSGRTFLGQPALILPNIFQYVKYIRQMDGFVGMYRGLSPKLLGIIVGSIGSEKIVNKLGLEAPPPPSNESKDRELTEEEEFDVFQKQLKRELVLHISGILITQPFHVISVRMMAQFIGNETTYKTIWGSIKEIWNTEGLFGFFSGVTPKLMFDVSVVVLTGTTSYLVSKHLIRDRANQPYFASFANFIYSTIMYPLNVVSSCMAVTGSRLAAGNPPYMPVYKNWHHCYNHLNVSGELKRGSSLFFRYHNSALKSTVPFPAISRIN